MSPKVDPRPGTRGSLPGNLPRLTSLRGFAALIVFFRHIGRWHVAGTGPFAIGYVGVAFFFILSGFVLAWSTPANPAVGSFYRRRFARVYPSHFVMIIVAALLPVTAYAVTWPRAIINVLMLQAWVPKESIAFSMNGVSWSLSCEFFFYATLPFALRRLANVNAKRRWQVALGYWGLTAALVVAGAAYTSIRGVKSVVEGGSSSNSLAHIAQTLAYVNPLARYGEFLVGVVAALAIREGWRLPNGRAATLLVVGIALTSVMPKTAPSADVGMDMVFFALIVLTVQRSLVAPKGWLTARPLEYAGELSFCFYLVHELTILNVGHWVGRGGFLVALLDLVAAASMAAVLHHAVEKPWNNALRRGTVPWRLRKEVRQAPTYSISVEPPSPQVPTTPPAAAGT